MTINEEFNLPQENAAPSTQDHKQPIDQTRRSKITPDSLGVVWKHVESIGQTVGEALQGRGNVVMVRVNNNTLTHLDMLVEAEIVKSRSEAAALLMIEGMKANMALFDRIREITDKIAQLRSQLRETVSKEEAGQNSK